MAITFLFSATTAAQVSGNQRYQDYQKWLNSSTGEYAYDHQKYHWLNWRVPYELRAEYTRAVLFQQLNHAESEIQTGVQCGNFYSEGESSRQEKIQLNKDYRGRANEEYKRRFTAATSRNERAMADYTACFGNELSNYSAIRAEGIGSFDEYFAARKRLEEDAGFYFIEDIDDYVTAIEQSIEAMNAGVVATIISTFDEVEFSHDGTTWHPAREGTFLKKDTKIRTGDRARARLQFHDKSSPTLLESLIVAKEDWDNKGPTIVNIAPKSEIRITQFTTPLNAHSPRNGILDVLRGTVRAFTKGWGKRSSYSIRTGTSLCGIRGTEVGVVYDPDANTVDYHLDHGDAYIDLGNGEIPLEPKTSVRVQNGQASAPQPTPADFWDSLVASTGDGKVVSNQTIIINPPDGSNTSSTPPKPTENRTIALMEAIKAEVNSRGTVSDEEELRIVGAFTGANSLMGFVQDGNANKALAHMQGDLYDSYSKAVENRSLFEVQDGDDGRIIDFERRCAVCNNDATLCGYIYDVRTEKRNNKQPYPVTIVMKPNEYGGMSATTFADATQKNIDYYADFNTSCR